MKLNLLGSMGVEVGGAAIDLRGSIRRSVLAHLAVHANQVVPVARLADDLWAGDPPPAAVGTIQTYVSQLRRQLGDDRVRLTTEGSGYRLALDDDELDVRRFEQAISSPAWSVPDQREVAGRLSDALALWRGPALDGFRGQSWADVEAARLDQLRLAAVGRWAAAATAVGDHAAVVDRLAPIVTDEPFREDLRRNLIVALYRQGRQAEALAEYQDLRTRLAEELGLDPSPALRELEAAILRQDQDLLGRTPGRSSAATDPRRADSVAERRTVSFVLTDLVDSTRQRERDSSEAFGRIRDHIDEVDAVVRSHGGRVFKTVGDGVWAVFDRASDATLVADAVRNGPGRDARPVRVAVHTGEAHAVGDDSFGRPLDRCARLCRLAHRNQVVVSETTALLLRQDMPPGLRLVERSAESLRGVPGPEHVFEVIRATTAPPVESGGAAAPNTPAVPFPPPLAMAIGGPLVGRDAEVGLLTKHLHTSHLYLVIGEPGIGKTTTVAAAARSAADDGAVVLFGRADVEVAVPHEPLLTAIAPVVAAAPPDHRRAIAALTDVDALRASPATFDVVRQRAYTAIADVLRDASRAAPVVLVLDDLQWAADETVALLRHVIRTTSTAGGPGPVVLATSRDDDPSRADQPRRIVGDLAARGMATTVGLDGLDETQVGELVGLITDVPSASTADLRSMTGGNPFLLHQTIELGGTSQLPVHEIVQWRLDRLSPPTRAVLAVAAVAGQEFRVPVVERAHGSDILDALDEAVAARLVTEQSATPGGYELVHGIVRDAVVGGLSAARRARLHRRVADALVEIELPGTMAEIEAWSDQPIYWGYLARVPARLATCRGVITRIAHHYDQAVPDGATREAVLFGELDIRLSLGGGGVPQMLDQVNHYLDLLNAHPWDPRHALRTNLLLARGAHLRFGQDEEARSAGADALAAARVTGRADVFAHTAYTTVGWASLDSADAAVSVCREALDGLGPGSGPLRPLLLATLALNLTLTDRAAEAIGFAEQALEAARVEGDPPVLGAVLFVVASVLGPGAPTHGRRRSIADELFALGTTSDDGTPIVAGVRVAMVCAFEAADRDDIDHNVDAIRAAFAGSEMSAVPAGLSAMWRGMLALAEGRFHDTDAEAASILAVAGSEANLVTSAQALQLFVARERGRSAELLPLLRAVSTSGGVRLASIRALHGLVALDGGERDEAGAVLADLLRDGISSLPPDATWAGSVAVLAELARAVGSDEHRQDLVDTLRPLGGLLIVNSWGVICHGAADRYLGGLLVELGELDDGIAGIERGVALEDRLGARALSARSNVWLADALVRRDGRGDRARASDLAAEAQDLAADLGMMQVASDASAVLERLGLPAAR